MLGVLGSPCETWSAARWNGGSRDPDGPRALRSARRPWGLADLTAPERRQLRLGSALLRATALLLYAAWARGFAAVMEHPECPCVADTPSSWRLPALRALFALDGVVARRIDQCTCGTPWMKPTRLCAVNLPDLGAELDALPGRGRCSPLFGNVHAVLHGRDDDGSWRTAPAKTYPPALCGALARAFARQCRRMLRGADLQAERPELPAWLEALCVPIDWYAPVSWDARAHDCAG